MELKCVKAELRAQPSSRNRRCGVRGRQDIHKLSPGISGDPVLDRYDMIRDMINVVI